MKFKEFNDWCNERVCDGRWGLKEAITCVGVCEDVLEHRCFREKAWRKHELRNTVEKIVEETNKIIEKIEKDTVF